MPVSSKPHRIELSCKFASGPVRLMLKFSKKSLFWLTGIAVMSSFIAVTLFSLINPVQDPEVVKFAGLEPIKKSEFLFELQKQRRRFGGANASECLSDLISTRIMDAFYREYGMCCSDELATSFLKKVPYFCGSEGQFDRAKFESYLRLERVSEEDYMKRFKRDLLCKLTLDILSGIPNPSYLSKSLSVNRLASRDIIVAHCNVKCQLHPSEPELFATYAASKKDFYIPELRSVKYFLVERTPAASIKEPEIRKYFLQNSSRLRAPLNPVRMPIAKALAAAKDKAKLESLRSSIAELASEADFEKLAKSFASKVSLIKQAKFSDIAKSKVFAPFAKDVFCSDKLSFSGPSAIEGKLVVWYVSEISPQRLLDFPDAKDLVLKKFIKLKGQELSSQKIVNLRAKLGKTKLTAQGFLKEMAAGGAETQTFEGLSASSKAVDRELIVAALGLCQGETSSVVFDPSTSRHCIIFVKKLKRSLPSRQDVFLDKGILRRKMYLEMQDYLAKKYSPVIVPSSLQAVSD